MCAVFFVFFLFWLCGLLYIESFIGLQAASRKSSFVRGGWVGAWVGGRVWGGGGGGGVGMGFHRTSFTVNVSTSHGKHPCLDMR